MKTPAWSRLAGYAWGVLLWNVLVALFGAYVRATGSGAGCGAHWPTCNGEVIPRAPQVETLIEFTHRATSGLAFLSVLALFLWALRAFPKGHPARFGAGLALFFMVTESLVGASLVLFGWTADNERQYRRGGERLRLELTPSGQGLTVHYSLSPQ